MKKNTIKKIALFATAVLTVTLAACEDANENPDIGVKNVQYWSGNTHSKDVYEKIISDYNENQGKKDGIFIKYELKENGTISQAIEVALQSGQAPDMFEAGSLAKFVENGYIQALEELPGGEEYLKKYEGKLQDKVQVYNGKTYCVPFNTTTGGLIYNKDMFKAAGIVDENGEAQPPETFAELREYAKKLTNPEKREYGIIFPIKWSAWFNSDIWYSMQNSVGHMGYVPQTGEYNFEPLVDIMQTFLDIKADKSFFPGAEGIDNDVARAQFSAGKIGMKFAFSYDVGVLNDQFPAECDWGVAPYPVLDKNEKYMQISENGSSAFINSKSKDTIGGEKLMAVYKLLTSDEMLCDLYKNGVFLPYDWDIVKDVKLGPDSKKGWAEFAQLAEISIPQATQPSRDYGSDLRIGERFVNDVWSGNMTPAELAAEYNIVSQKAVERYYAANPDESPEQFINKDWNIKR